MVKDLTGIRFGMFTVVSFSRKSKSPDVTYWNCLCDCGNEFERITGSMKNTLSCGCFRKLNTSRLQKTHGLRSSKEYSSWQNMKKRCYNPSSNRYKDYGGRGIVVCDRWRDSFENFIADMGRMPTDKRYSIDRIDNNGNYEPSNCRWATYLQQAKTNRGCCKPGECRINDVLRKRKEL
jgi:hypothetical protein